MGLLSSIAGIIATFIPGGGPILGLVVRGIGGIIEGEDPLQAFLGGITSFGLSQFMGGNSFFSGFGGEAANAAAPAAGEAVGGAVAEEAANTAVSGWEGPAADVATQAPGAAQMIAAVPGTPGGYVEPAAFDPTLAATESAVPGGDLVRAEDYRNVGMGKAEPPGIINRGLAWMNKNPVPTMAAVTAIGGAGQGLLNREIAEKRIIAERELQDQRLANAQKLEEWKRAFTQGGSYFDTGGVGFKSTGTTGLRRPDGTLVYARPGIIAGQMRG